MNQTNPPGKTLHELAGAVELREGVDGVTRALWLLACRRVTSTREWSQALRIPVPVMAALRRELEKKEILQPEQKGLRLTDSGETWLDELFGAHEIPNSTCTICQGFGRIMPPELMPVLEEFTDICEARPEINPALDQSHATPETGLRRALYLLEQGWLGAPLLFIGDDDFISLACLLLRDHYLTNKENLGEIGVVDVDERYLDLITAISEDEVSTVVYDVRQELPGDLQAQFQIAVTDPAYTVNGITVFSYRCFQALQPAGRMLLSMPMLDPENLQQVQSHLIQMGFVLNDIHPDFNRYKGSSVHAHVSHLFLWQKLPKNPPEKSFPLRYTPFYTQEQKNILNAQTP